MKNKFSQRGFTLIEMLVVIGIVGLLASVVLVGLGNARKSGRDAKRISDLRSIQTGLEGYYNQCGFYPGTATCAAAPASTAVENYTGLAAALAPLGAPAVPNDPDPAKSYKYASNGQSYVLQAVLETHDNVLASDTDGTAVLGIIDCGTTGAAEREYCIVQ